MSSAIDQATLSTAELLLLGQLERVCELPASGEPCKACGGASIMHSFKRILAAVRHGEAVRHEEKEKDHARSDHPSPIAPLTHASETEKGSDR